MRRAILISAALLLSASEPIWSRQDQQSQQAQQQSSSQSQKQAQAPQQDSLAAAARKAREQKKEAPKNTKVFTNDNIPLAGGISSVGEAAEEHPEKEGKPVKAGAVANGSEGGSAKPSSAPNDEAQWRSRFAKLRHKLEQDQADLDVMQRELGVLDTQYYSDPNKQLQQQLTREDINKKTADIEARKKDVEADKQAISDAEDELRKAGGEPGWANPQ